MRRQTMSFIFILFIKNDSFLCLKEYEEAMNKLPINERAVIKDFIQKIQDDNMADIICGNRRLQEEQIERLKKLRRNIKITRNIHIASCVGVVAYVGFTLITR